MDRVLVVGGAGYIGSHTCLALAQDGFVPVAFDNLSNGHEEFVRFGPLEIGDIADEARLVEAIERHRPAAIIHFAALIEVGQSVEDPLRFYRNNVAGTLSLLSAARRAGVDRLVFSSTCATYGAPRSVPIAEDHPQEPLSPYGRSKRMVEEVIGDLSDLGRLRAVTLRYFNAAGADPEGRIGEWHDPETHAIPLAIEAALGRRPVFRIFGTGYDTADGTCVRDYVHVMDLADAHRRAVRYLLDGGASVALNLGTGTGTSVAELVAAIERVTGRAMPVAQADPRPGDAAILVADNRRAAEILDWRPTRDLDEIIRSAFAWHSRRNAGT